jgi:hypothetical protein
MVFYAMPLSTIFQLYCGGQFYWWRKTEYPEKTPDAILTGRLFIGHHLHKKYEFSSDSPDFILCKIQVKMGNNKLHIKFVRVML